MRRILDWKCAVYGENDFFDASVPGNAQYDYAKAHGFGDVNYADNCKSFRKFEDKRWVYRAEFDCEKCDGLWFVSDGIDYECDIYLNGQHLLHNIGMYNKIQIDISKFVKSNNVLEIHIQPVPKDGQSGDRSEAAQTTKPAASYGWDWHPRLIPSGMWKEAYVEERGTDFVTDVSVSYRLDEELKNAEVVFEVDGSDEALIKLYDPNGEMLYSGTERTVKLNDIKLWWCNGQGKPSLYTYKVTSLENTVSGKIGFRKIELLMNEGAWEEPSEFPKTRSAPPMTIYINNRPIFAKGSNWVNPEIFYGNVTRERYDSLLTLVRDANMNIIRCWGGAPVGRDEFFDLCDEYGILVWQEFPLACNLYRDTDYYLSILEKEAVCIINRVKNHACHCLWCGGNELFNRWSGLTDQSLALRLINKLCYEHDRNKPFLPTAPLMGMGHGHYMFYDKNVNKTVFEMYGKSHFCAYSEFGVPSVSDIESLRAIIPKDIIDNPMPDTPWQTHHAFGAWDAGGKDAWLCRDVIEHFFGSGLSVEELIEYSQLLQGEGLKFIFEEARRQRPYCSMALNWCFNEPWITAANQSIIMYPARPKKSYYEVKDALRNTMPSLKMYRFVYNRGDIFSGELWLLNDACKKLQTSVEVFLEYDDIEEHILTWNTGTVNENENKRGHVIQFEVPKAKDKLIYVSLKSKEGSSKYALMLKDKKKEISRNVMNG